LLDTKRENVIGKKAYETIPGLDKKWLDIFGKVALTGESSSYEEYASNLDKWFAGTVFSPQKGMVAGTFIDITERKRAEQALAESESRFREIFNTVSDAIFIHDAETGRIVDVNRRMCEMYGITREEAFACGPDDLSAGVPPYSSAEAIEKIHLARIVGPQTFDWLARARDGHLFWVEVSLQFALIGSQQRILAVVRDITERREFMEELKRSNTDLEQFSYAVSHDMRQPLRMISSYLQLLELKLAGQLDGEKRDYFNFAIEGAKRIDQMLVELLEYSRIGRIGEPQAWVESRAVLDEALKFLQPALAEARADLNITGDWPNIFARHDEILRLFQNLIGNAAKFRVAGRIPEITVTSVVVKNEWHLCVADNGVGIATDQIKRLFQVFHRLQSREAYEGTGIGLALCRKIAEHHKGRIWAESAGEGQGSKFYVVLPMMHEKATS
jgi:PAS domain S-box-containing protein